MPTPAKPSTVRGATFVLGIAAAFIVTAFSLYVVLGSLGGPTAPTANSTDQRPRVKHTLRTRNTLDAQASSKGLTATMSLIKGAAQVKYGTGAVQVDEARTSFATVMTGLDTLSEHRIAQEEWTEVYRVANDAFTALSIHLDAHNDSELKELEKAHKRLVRRLAALDVEGGKHRPH